VKIKRTISQTLLPKIAANTAYYQELLTIGIPVYNEERYLKKAVESCIHQAGCVIVSDNASTDDTQKIGTALAKKYPNLIYIRQKKNIGGGANFKTCLDAAKTKYFMWHGGHDYLDCSYTKHMLHTLENSDAAGCWPASRSVDINGEELGIFDCWFASRLSGDNPVERVYTLIAHLHNCVGLFGIYRRDLAMIAQNQCHYIIGGDHVFLCEMIKSGRILYCPRSVYNWRQTKLGLTDSQNMKVWEQSLGNAQNVIKNSRQEMRTRQLNILKSAPVRGEIFGLIKKIKLVSKARKKLKARFGDD
jgi:glycosyltransferase involved in cell wall biosynthesis